MNRAKALVLLCALLSGCVHVPERSLDIPGEITFSPPLTRNAYVKVDLYGQQNGHTLLLTQQRYQLNMLPLKFSFTLPPSTYEVQELFVRGALSWKEDGPEQATGRVGVVAGSTVQLNLQSRGCFPTCAGPRRSVTQYLGNRAR